MPESLLNILKIAFLALLWLFFLRVLRAVWAELKTPAPTPAATVAAAPGSPAAPTIATPAPARAAAGNGPPAQLLVLESGEQQGQVFSLGEEVTLGRGGGCAVALRDRMVSQLHARIFRRSGQLFVEDLGSTNGTLLNGKKVSGPSPLQRGDRLQLGKTVLELTGPRRGSP